MMEAHSQGEFEAKFVYLEFLFGMQNTCNLHHLDTTWNRYPYLSMVQIQWDLLNTFDFFPFFLHLSFHSLFDFLLASLILTLLINIPLFYYYENKFIKSNNHREIRSQREVPHLVFSLRSIASALESWFQH